MGERCARGNGEDRVEMFALHRSIGQRFSIHVFPFAQNDNESALLTNVTVSALDGALDGLCDLVRGRLPCSETDDRDFGTCVQFECLTTGSG